MKRIIRGVISFSCLTTFIHKAIGLSMSSAFEKRSLGEISRRSVLIATSSTFAGLSNLPQKSIAAETKGETIDLAAIKAAQSRSATVRTGGSGVVPMQDPSPLLAIRGGLKNKSSIKIPRVGYSFYKTAPDTAARCMSLALRAGVKHFDVGTLYNSNSEVSEPLKRYLDVGIEGVNFSGEKVELLEIFDATKKSGDDHAIATLSSGLLTAASPAPMGSAGRRGRREGLFISHKVSNEEQSVHRADVRRAVKAQIAALGCGYLDMVSIHSPLTDKSRRHETYAALLELRDAGFVKSVGVCNYGLGPLNEIFDSGLDLPSVNQLELSPFNTHADIVAWCKSKGISLSCGAWSKLSGVDGPADQWAIVADMAMKKGMTKAQILARWSLQKGYVCVPRSSASSKLERLAIAENAYGGINILPSGKSVLTAGEMDILDGLNIDYKAGRLGRRDGWGNEDVVNQDWDPTDFV